MGAEWCAHPLPLHGLPFAHYPEGGVSMTSCIVLHAQPLHAPPFGRHPAHAVPHVGQHVRGTRKVGRTGVMHAERHTGSCSHAMGEGRRREAAPSSCYPRVVRSPIEVHEGGQKGEGRGTPACKRRVRRLRRCTHPHGPSHPPLFAHLSRSMPECGRHLLCTPFTWQGGGGMVRAQNRGPCFVRAPIASEGGGH